MADAYCGPSNALQNLQKHSTVDRQLQQDRLVSRAPQAEGFRSAPSQVDQRDAEFQAFQAGQLPLQHLEQPQFQQNGLQHFRGRPQVQQPNSPAWVDDFQRLNVAPMSQGIAKGKQPEQSQWHQEFAQMGQYTAGPAPNLHAPLERLSSIAPGPYAMQQPMFQSSMSMMPQYTSSFLGAAPQAQMDTSQQINAETFDEEAFARAFDEAAQAEMELLEPEQGTLEPEPQIRIGADLINHPNTQETFDQSRENDEMARTAGQLLNSVSGDTSEKFQNSTFLQLMRQLRDKQVVVDGDKIRPADSGPAGNDEGLHESLTAVMTPSSMTEEVVERPATAELAPPMTRTNSNDILSVSYTAFSPLNHRRPSMHYTHEYSLDIQSAIGALGHDELRSWRNVPAMDSRPLRAF